MSWVAEQNATISASSAVAVGAAAGSLPPSSTMETISAPWVASIQPRRLPKRRVSHGSGTRSTSGAQRNFSVYGVPASANRPIVVLSMPTSASHSVSVPKVSASGRPLEKPRKPTATTRGSR